VHRPLHIAVFGSGSGTNFEAIHAAIQQGKIPHTTIRVVLSNNPAAGILERARKRGIPAVHLSPKQFAHEREFNDVLLATLREHDVNFIVLAGYMKRVPPRIISAYRERIVNIHPALLPKFGGQGMYGMHVHEAVIAAGERFTGATVHIVDEEYDRGPILLQKRVAVADSDTPASLAAKVLSVEHELYPEALKMIAEGKALHTNVVAT
jgi:formyltetrahydrofolate-dependent phosphoribosylglycinamide formyltransferase